MRADRLIAVLLLLQARGRVTAAEVAEELEVSERTARRDLEALGMAGVPVWSQAGRNGGWQLAGGGRIDLSGLTAAETRALFLMAGPSTATPELRAALRKVVRALPESFREQAEAASGAVMIDPAGWGRSAPDVVRPPHLEALQDAVVGGRAVLLGYRDRTWAVTERVVHPLGLVSKGRSWYLVAGTEAGQRTFRVDRVQSLEQTGDAVERPADFDLAAAWRAVNVEVDRRRTPTEARAVVVPSGLGACQWVLGDRLATGAPGPDGRVEVVLRGQSARSLARELAGLGDLIEVLDPPEVRDHLAAIGAHLSATYR